MMTLCAALTEVDITPEVPIEKAGWLHRVMGEKILDPIYARVLILESNGVRIGFVSLDLLSVRWTQVGQIRAAAERCGIPKTNLMVAATHSHAGPAIVSAGETKRDDKYIEFMVARIGQAIEKAVSSLAPAKIGITSGIEGRISFIRRFIMKDGSTRTHAPALSPEIRCHEGVIDPELGVLCVKDLKDNILGFAVNFTCHPTHHGGDNLISAGYPGQLSLELKKAFGCGCVTVFLNGAFGNIHHANQYDPAFKNDMDHMGRVLGDDVQKLLPKMTFVETASLQARTTTLKLPIRDMDGPFGVGAKVAQPFRNEIIYGAAVRKLREKKAKRDHALAEVQCLRIGHDAAFVSIPAEYFCQHGLRIKTESRVPRTYVVGAANGMVGYVPTKEAFPRGGYETTLAMWSKLAPEAGDLLADAAIDLLGRKA